MVANRSICQLVAGVMLSLLVAGCGNGISPPPVPPPPPKPISTSYIVVPACTGAASGVGSDTGGFAGPTDTDIRFNPVKNISSNYGLSFAPAIALAPGGNVYLAWYDNSSGQNEILFAKSADFGKHYTAPANLSNNLGSGQFPSVVADANGNIYVAWQDTEYGTSQILYVKSTDGGETFTAPARLLTDSARAQTNVNLASDSQGNIYAAFIRGQSLSVSRLVEGQNAVELYRYDPQAPNFTSDPALTIDANNVLHVAWTAFTVSNSERGVLYSRSQLNPVNKTAAAFSTPATLASGNDLSRPAIAADAVRGMVYVAYIMNNTPPAEIYLAVSNNSGTSFATPKNITNNSGVSINPSLAIGTDGVLYFGWQDTSVGNYEAMFSRSTDFGATFSAAVDVAPSAQGSLYTEIAVDEQNNIHLVWDDNRYLPDPNNATAQGNFEIATVVGHENLPVVKNVSTSPTLFSPNNDGVEDSITFNATFTAPIDWRMTVYDADDFPLYAVTGSGSSLSYTWTGVGSNGVTVPDGAYRYEITGKDVAGLDAIPAGGSFVVNTVATTAPSSIKCFSQEASSFSPNSDAFKDSIGIDAEFNKSVDWELKITDINGVTVFSKTGTGLTMSARWAGEGADGLVVPEGNYKVAVLIPSDDGNLIGSRRSAKIDVQRPELQMLTVSPAVFSPNGDGIADVATISALPTEKALVTIYVYEANGTLVRELDRNYRDPANGQFTIDWDGLSDTKQKVPAGDYKIKMWCRDLGGNTALTYPYELAVKVN